MELARAVDHNTSSVSDGRVQDTLLQSLGETGSSSGAASGSPPQAVSLCFVSAPGDSGRSQQHGDTWTLVMQEQYPDLRGDDFLATLTLHAHLQSTNISNIEAKHASVRRQLTARSVQTWALKMPTASAEWLCQHIRRGKLSKLSSRPKTRQPRKASTLAPLDMPRLCV